MKTFILALTLMMGSAFALEMSAFTSKNVLYVTAMGDGCNSGGIHLDLDYSCQADRMTADYNTTCKADLGMYFTELFCPNAKMKPVVFSLDLAKANVTDEAEVLILNIFGEELKVKINK